ncbi:MAG: hypothetical protein Q7S52_00390 [bacterium]|nr:hypothetical protein [bacterium]
MSTPTTDGHTASESMDRHPLLYTKVRVEVPFFWLFGIDPYAGKEGTIVHIEWNSVRGEMRYTVLFETTRGVVYKTYSQRGLEFLE